MRLSEIYFKLILTAVFWGGTFIAGRVVAANVGPYSAAFLRFVFASVVLLIFTRKVEGRLPKIKKKHIIPIILLGLTGICLYNIFFFKGLRIISASRAALIIANNPIFITIFASLIFKEKLNRIRTLGIIISVTGAIIVISKGSVTEILNGNLGWGELFIFLCVLSWAAFSLIGKTITEELSPLVTISYSSVAGTVFLLVPACFEGVLKDFVYYSPLDWLSILYLGIFGTAIGFVWYYEGIKALGPSKASLFINFVPISAVLLAFLLLGEPITLSLLVGTVFVSSGVYLTNTR